VVVHGWGEHSGRYAALARWFADRGVHVYALDHRGHGRSAGRRGHIARFSQYLSDLLAFRQAVASWTSLPQLLLGHSFGGCVVLRTLEVCPEAIAAAVVSSPWLALFRRPPRWKTAMGTLLADVAPALQVPTNLDADELSTDPLVGMAYRSDPLVHRVMTPRAYREITQLQRVTLAEGDRIASPLLVLLAGEDRIASAGVAGRFADSLAGDVTVHRYHGFYHEVLNERAKAKVFADVERWLERVLRASRDEPAEPPAHTHPGAPGAGHRGAA
jgi:lysophospholipase